MIYRKYKNGNTYVIAEAGVNHNGDIKLAKKLIEVASKANADAIKFQTFKSNKLVSKFAPKAEYQIKNTKNTGNQLKMLKKLELNYEDFYILREYCRKKKIDFITTAFDLESLDFIVNKLKVNILKIPSGEITNLPYILKCALSGLDIILSTGMSNLKEIKVALGVIAFGYINSKNLKHKPTLKNFKKAFMSKKGKQIIKNKVTVLHCSTEYPVPIEDINLNAMLKIAKVLDVDVGYSDHSKGITVPIIATSIGAKIIEKHFTLDKKMKGPDHKASLDPDELKNMVNEIKKVKIIKGIHEKKPYKSEQKNMIIARKSLVANKKIKKGEYFTENNLVIKRPGSGISPYKYWQILGKIAKKNYEKDELI